MTLVLPPTPAQGGVVVDTPVDRMLRGRAIERELAYAERLEDEAAERALAKEKGAAYLEYWAGIARARAADLASKPFRDAMPHLVRP